MIVMKTNHHDPLVTLPQAAIRMGVNERRARKILIQNLIRPVRTVYGTCYRQEDVDAVRKAGR